MKKSNLFLLSALVAMILPASVYSYHQEDERVTVGTDLVSVNVTVTDSRGMYVQGLTRDNFALFDNKASQQIAHFSSEESPFSIGVIYDMHGTAWVRADGVLGALGQFAVSLRPDDDVFFVGFNETGSLVVDFIPNTEQLSSQLVASGKNSPSSLYDAVLLAAQKVYSARNAKKAILIISDGEDHNSRRSYDELRNRLREFDTQVYTVVIADPELDRRAGFGRWVFEDNFRQTGRRTFLEGADAAMGRAVLDEMARMSGGRAFVPAMNNELELVGICTQISLELRRLYTVSFYPTNATSDSKWHKIKIIVRTPQTGARLNLSYREGYQLSKR